MAIFYLDPESGSDAADGSTWALAWKTITSGATAARIAPGDIIRIAKSAAPTKLTGATGRATWNNLSKTVTLAEAQTANITLCATNWTAIAGGDCTPTLIAVGTDAKEGANCVRLTLDAAVQTAKGQAYFNTGTLDLSGYQKLSFWIKNSAAILATHYTVRLCSDTGGVTAVDTFVIPAIPSTARWVPLTIARNDGGNLGSAIQSIAVYSDSVAPANNSYILIDNFLACTTDGLNLQSLISKNTLEQGGNEGWYGIQSINGTTVLLDNDTNTLANAGRGYSGVTETVDTYKRETIKTALAAVSAIVVQECMDSGTVGNNIQYQGGYDKSSGNQTGETFFDGLNGNGYGLRVSSKQYNTLNYLNFSRYSYGAFFNGSSNNTILIISNLNNNLYYGIYFNSLSNNNTISTISNLNNNSSSGAFFNNSNNNTISTISNLNNNLNYGIIFSNNSNNNTILTISNVNNNLNYGIYFSLGNNNTIKSLSTIQNGIASIFNDAGTIYITKATIAEATKVTGFTNFANGKVFINNIGGFSNIWCDYGNIISQNVTAGGTGKEWKLSPTDVLRALNYPLDLSVCRVAVVANKLVTVTLYFKKSHATNIGARLVVRGGQLDGVAEAYTDAPSNTTRNNVTLTFTPTEAGVIEIEAWAFWIASTANTNVIVDDISITQAS